MKYTCLLIALFYYNLSVAQQESDSITVTQNTTFPYHEIYSTPYSPQVTQFPAHGTVTWEGSPNSLGLVGENTLYYQPDTDFFGMDTLQVGYWKQSQFGPIFTKRFLYISVVPACSRTLTLAQKAVAEDRNVSSLPYRPQFTILPSHGSVSWLGGTDSLGVIGENVFFYQPNLDFLGQDTLEVGYWTEDQFGPVFNKCVYFINVLPASNFIEGRIFFDMNGNCSGQGLEEGLENWLIQVARADNIFYTVSGADGFFSLAVIDGNYTVTAILPNQTWGFCENDIEISVANGSTEAIAFAAQVIQLKPFLDVRMATGALETCRDNFYQIDYCNQGTASVEDAYVKLSLDPSLEFMDANSDFTNSADNEYIFPVGHLAPNECGNFKVYFTVSCESEPGQSHCTEAQIFPIEDFDWAGPTIEVDSRCEGDSVYFFIKNTTEANMTSASNFIVIEDQVVYFQDDFMLDGGDSLVVSQATNGRTFRLETTQSAGFPYASFPSASVEGCVNDTENEISRGIISQYPEDDFESFIAVDCRASVLSAEPNDLMAFPTGYGDSHLISRTTELEYVLTFQNTGADTIQHVRLRDFISPHLDMTTIRFGASSHPYHFSSSASNILEFTFDNIQLPPQRNNEMASRGFLTFKISQQAFNPLNTLISNHAAVSFDGATELLLNPVFHTVQEKFIRTTKPLPAHPKKYKSDFSLFKQHRVYPNPTSDVIFIVLATSKKAMKTVELFDVQGRLVATYAMRHSPFAISTSSLKKGIYFYNIKIEGEEIRGKFVVR